MAYFYHDYNELFVCNRVDDAIDALTNSVFIFTRQLFTSWRARFSGQPFDLLNNAGAISFWKGFDLLDRRRLKKDLIVCHASSDP